MLRQDTFLILILYLNPSDLNCYFECVIGEKVIESVTCPRLSFEQRLPHEYGSQWSKL